MEMSISTFNTGNAVRRQYTNAIVSSCCVKYSAKCAEAKKVCLGRRKQVAVGSYLNNKEVHVNREIVNSKWELNLWYDRKAFITMIR